MHTLKIEYVDGVLTAVEYNGRSYMDLPLSALHFRHEKNHNPYFKVEVEEGGELHQPVSASAPAAIEHNTEAVAKEGELIPAQQSENQPAPHKRKRNRYRSNRNVQTQ